MMSSFISAFRSTSDPSTGKHPLIKRILARVKRKQPVIVVGERLDGRSLLIQSSIDPAVMAEHGFTAGEFLIAGVTGCDIQDATAESFWRTFILPQLREEAAKTADPELLNALKNCCTDDLSIDIDETFYQIQRSGRTPLIVWDEFERVTDNASFDQAFFSRLRSVNQMYDVTFLIGSAKPFGAFNLWTVSTSPFFNIFYTIDLDRIELAL